MCCLFEIIHWVVQWTNWIIKCRRITAVWIKQYNKQAAVVLILFYCQYHKRISISVQYELIWLLDYRPALPIRTTELVFYREVKCVVPEHPLRHVPLYLVTNSHAQCTRHQTSLQFKFWCFMILWFKVSWQCQFLYLKYCNFLQGILFMTKTFICKIYENHKREAIAYGVILPYGAKYL